MLDTRKMVNGYQVIRLSENQGACYQYRRVSGKRTEGEWVNALMSGCVSSELNPPRRIKLDSPPTLPQIPFGLSLAIVER